MNAQLVRAISQAVENLIEKIQEDEHPQGEIKEIHIIPDPLNPDTHFVVYADLLVITHLHGSSDPIETTFPYFYAIYINKETCAAETDGY
jgi:hypothetical protein